MKAVYLKHTQSHKIGDHIEFNGDTMQHQQLLERGFIALVEQEKETKVAGPKETKPATKPATKKAAKR